MCTAVAWFIALVGLSSHFCTTAPNARSSAFALEGKGCTLVDAPFPTSYVHLSYDHRPCVVEESSNGVDWKELPINHGGTLWRGNDRIMRLADESCKAVIWVERFAKLFVMRRGRLSVKLGPNTTDPSKTSIPILLGYYTMGSQVSIDMAIASKDMSLRPIALAIDGLLPIPYQGMYNEMSYLDRGSEHQFEGELIHRVHVSGPVYLTVIVPAYEAELNVTVR